MNAFEKAHKAHMQAVQEFRELGQELCGSFERLSAKLEALNEMIEKGLENIEKIREGAKPFPETR